MMPYHIAYISDDNYFIPTIASIQSLIDNIADGDNYFIHVCAFKLSKRNILRLESLSTNCVTVCVHVFESREYSDKLSRINQKTHVSPAALIKFELPTIFTHLDNILYLDSDIIINKDLSELLDISLDGYYLAASQEFYSFLNKRNYSFCSGYSAPYYFNSGVMFLNLKKMREDSVTDKLWDYKLNHAKSRLMDQETFNAICANNAIPLSVKWNFNPVFFSERYIYSLNRLYHESYSGLSALMADIYIIHYVGAFDKPWVYKTARMREVWDTAYRNAGYVTESLELQEANMPNSSKWESLKKKKSLHGLGGLFCYLINTILHRVI